MTTLDLKEDGEPRRWTVKQVADQLQKVKAVPPNEASYQRGRFDCMIGSILPAERLGYDLTQQRQWEQGWADEWNGSVPENLK